MFLVCIYESFGLVLWDGLGLEGGIFRVRLIIGFKFRMYIYRSGGLYRRR